MTEDEGYDWRKRIQNGTLTYLTRIWFSGTA